MKLNFNAQTEIQQKLEWNAIIDCNSDSFLEGSRLSFIKKVLTSDSSEQKPSDECRLYSSQLPVVCLRLRFRQTSNASETCVQMFKKFEFSRPNTTL